MKKARKTANWIALAFSAGLFIWSLISYDCDFRQNQKANNELNLFEMSIEELMKIEVASASKKKNNIPKTSWIIEPFMNRV